MPVIDKPGIYVWGDPENRWNITVAGSSIWATPHKFLVTVGTNGKVEDVAVFPPQAPPPQVFLGQSFNWTGTIQGGWVNVRFRTYDVQVMQLTLFLDLDGDGVLQPATKEEARSIVFLLSYKVNPRDNPFIMAAPEGADNLLPNQNFRLGTGTLGIHVLTYTIQDLIGR
jgi:hypothetical protein